MLRPGRAATWNLRMRQRAEDGVRAECLAPEVMDLGGGVGARVLTGPLDGWHARSGPRTGALRVAVDIAAGWDAVGSLGAHGISGQRSIQGYLAERGGRAWWRAERMEATSGTK